jgi:ribosomal protein S18 acetylase RimI-like enzyme
METITFTTMTREEFDSYIKFSWANYIEQEIIGGSSNEEAENQAKRAELDLIPNGFETDNNYFYNIKKNGKTVGYLWLWFNVKNNNLFIPEVYIKETYRGKGIGKSAMSFSEKKAIELNAKKLKLHVFGHNTNAQNLYKKMGFKPTNVMMEKLLISK